MAMEAEFFQQILDWKAYKPRTLDDASDCKCEDKDGTIRGRRKSWIMVRNRSYVEADTKVQTQWAAWKLNDCHIWEI